MRWRNATRLAKKNRTLNLHITARDVELRGRRVSMRFRPHNEKLYDVPSRRIYYEEARDSDDHRGDDDRNTRLLPVVVALPLEPRRRLQYM